MFREVNLVANANELLRMIKIAAMDVYNAQTPMNIMYGTVTSISPLRVQIDAKLTLEEVHLEVVKSLSDYEIEMSVNGGTRQTYVIYNGLKVNDKVAMLRFEGGRRFLVIDRV